MSKSRFRRVLTLAGGRCGGRGGDDHVGVAHAVARRRHGHGRGGLRRRRGQLLVAVRLPVHGRVARRRSSPLRRHLFAGGLDGTGREGVETSAGTVDRFDQRSGERGGERGNLVLRNGTAGSLLSSRAESEVASPASGEESKVLCRDSFTLRLHPRKAGKGKEGGACTAARSTR